MKRNTLALILALALLLALSACGSAAESPARPLHYQDIYKHGILTPEEKGQRAEIRQAVADCIPEGMMGLPYSVSIHPERIEVALSYSDERITTEPDGWDDAVKGAQSVCSDLAGVMQERGKQTAVLYLSDKRSILLTVKNGELLYNRYKSEKRPSLEELNARVDAWLEESRSPGIDMDEVYADLKAAGYTDFTTVYVSSRSNTIHSISDCSGMKHYTEMLKEDADKEGYRYCPNCW